MEGLEGHGDLATVAEIKANLDVVRSRIDAAGGTDVEVLAVTKGFDVELAHRAVCAGFVTLGENYAQEMERKAAGLAELLNAELNGHPVEVAWRFIGRLQRNKVRRIAPIVASWDSVDRGSLVDEIAKRAPAATILVQVNVSEEPGKGGCEPAEVPALVDRARSVGLVVDGLMTVGRTGAPADARGGFRRLRTLCDTLQLKVCSMGMSGDLEVAVEEGSTLVRVGTALFGPRPNQRG